MMQGNIEELPAGLSKDGSSGNIDGDLEREAVVLHSFVIAG